VQQSVRHGYVCFAWIAATGARRSDATSPHGMDLNRDDYLKRWGLKSDHPLTAPAYSEQRSMLTAEFDVSLL